MTVFAEKDGVLLVDVGGYEFVAVEDFIEKVLGPLGAITSLLLLSHQCVFMRRAN
jgi:hypothetical protein